MKQIFTKDGVSWIGPEYKDRQICEETNTPIETTYFLLEFFLDETHGIDAKLLISAHSRYKLYVNGDFVTFGPCKSDEYHRYCERLDISGFLKDGQNQILAKVVSYPTREGESGSHVGPHWSYNKSCGCCLLMQGDIICGEKRIPIGTGIGEWYYKVSCEMTPMYDNIAPWMGYKESVDGSDYLEPFAIPDNGWYPAVKSFSPNTCPYGVLPVFPLYEREIPLLSTIKRNFVNNSEDVIIVSPNSREVLRFDAGEIVTGFFRLCVEGGAGSVITIKYSEAYFQKEDGKYVKKKRNDNSGIIYGHSDIFRPSGRNQCYEPFWFRTFRYVEIEALTASECLRLCVPGYVETGYPLNEVSTIGPENEQWLKWLWEVSLRTLKLCMHETYEDCPYYEQLQYTMDTRLEILFTYALCGDVRLARKTIYEYHSSKLPNGMLQSRYPSNSPQVIPVFSLHWIFMLQDYYIQTADKDYLREYLGTMDQILCYFRRHKKNGLVSDLGYWETVDWTQAWSDNTGVPHACNLGASTIQNLQYIYALKIAAELMQLFGFCDISRSYSEEADDMVKSIYKECYNSEIRLFTEGPGFEEYSQHSQIWAVLCEIGSTESRKELLLKVLHNKKLIPCSYPTVFYMFRAFEKTDMYEYTAELWDLWKTLYNRGLTTVPEQIFGNPRSDCHAWGSLLLYEFTRNILGVQHMAPGFIKISIRPKGFYIEQAQGTVYVPGGQIHINRKTIGDVFHIETTPDCPQPVELYLPDGRVVSIENYKTVSHHATLKQNEV